MRYPFHIRRTKLGLFLMLLAASPAGAQQGRELAASAREILQRHCGECHSPSSPRIQGGFDAVLDRDRLVALGHVVPGRPDESYLLERIENGSMPPSGSMPRARPSTEEKARIREWIRLGAPPFQTPEAPRPFLDHRAIVTAIAQDLGRISPDRQSNVRYVSMAHLFNANVRSEELDSARAALSKLLNSLSMRKEITVPVAVGESGTLFRIEFDRYGWERSTWDRLLRIYPYGYRYDDDGSLRIRTLTSSPIPYLRGDWLVATASRASVYHEILYRDLFHLGASPRAFLTALESKLSISRLSNIRRAVAVRSGFNGSGVSQHNRIIERHPIEARDYEGAYWISYDFSGSSPDPAKRENIFSFPLGPAELFPGIRNPFRHAGGEVIFNLPNGLQAYVLVDNQGNRIDKAPTTIVSDPSRPDRAVENAVSCMACHADGIIPKSDQVRASIASVARPGTGLQSELVRRLYVESQVMAPFFAGDAARFRAALRMAAAVVDGPEPISRLTLRFEKSLSALEVAAELGLTELELRRRIQARNGVWRHADVRELLSPLAAAGGTVKRDAFEEKFSRVLAELVPEAH